jgi:hypothetical protein
LDFVMSQFPNITTAIPKRRYQLSDYSVTLLGEVESSDPVNYQYILALVPMGETKPNFFVCSERVPPKDRADGAYRLRVINSAMSEVMDQADSWGDIDAFAEQGLQLAQQALGLTSHEPMRLM